MRGEAEEREGEGSDAAGDEREDAGERAGDRLDVMPRSRAMRTMR